MIARNHIKCTTSRLKAKGNAEDKEKVKDKDKDKIMEGVFDLLLSLMRAWSTPHRVLRCTYLSVRMQFMRSITARTVARIVASIIVVLIASFCSSNAVHAGGPIFGWKSPDVGTPGYVEFEDPRGIDFDEDGNAYISDNTANRIFKIGSDNNVVTSWGSTGSGEGEFNGLQDFHVDRIDERVYVAEYTNKRVQVFDYDGEYVTQWLVGIGVSDVVRFGEYVYIVGWGIGIGHQIVKYDLDGELVEVVATEIPPIYGLDVDRVGNLYSFCEDTEHICKYAPDGTVLARWGSFGSGNGQFNDATDLAVVDFGGVDYVFVVDYGNDRVQVFTTSGEFQWKWGEPGSEYGQFSRVWGIADDPDGNIHTAEGYYSGEGNKRVQKFSPQGVFFGSIGIGGSSEGQFLRPGDVTVDSNDAISVVDHGNSRVQRFSKNGELLNVWGDEEAVGVVEMRGIAAGLPNRLFVVDSDWTAFTVSRIHEFTDNGSHINTFGSLGMGDGQFLALIDVAFSDGSVFTLESSFLPRVQKFNSEGVFIRKWGASGSGDGQFGNPESITADMSGNVYVADTGNHRIQKFDSDGTFLLKWGSAGSGEGQFISPKGIAVDADGFVYVADTGNHRVQKFTSDGEFVMAFGTQGSGNTQFNSPQGIAILSDGSWVVADTGNHRVVSFYFDEEWPGMQVSAVDAYVGAEAAIRGSVTEGKATVSSVEYQLDCPDGVCDDEGWTACSADDGVFDEAAEAFTCTVSEELSDGSHTVYVRSTDSNGNTTESGSEETLTFTVDATAPVFGNLPEGGQVSVDEGEVVETGAHLIRVSPEDTGAGVDRVEFYVDGDLVCTVTEADGEGEYSCSVELGAGEHVILVVVYDGADNTAAVIRNVTAVAAVTEDPPTEELAQTGEGVWMILGLVSMLLLVLQNKRAITECLSRIHKVMHG